MFAIPNLSSSSAEPGLPWRFDGFHLVPVEALGKDGKARRHDWITAPKTTFNCYTLFESLNPNGRITGGDKEESNPPRDCHGIAADYDLPMKDVEIDAAIERMDIKPNWREVTLSGFVRLVWLFPEPVAIPSYSFAVAWMKNISTLIPVDQMPGLDEQALHAPERMFTNGCRWEKITDEKISWGHLLGHYVKFSDKFDFSGPEFGFEIPLDQVSEQLKAKFPGVFPECWPSDFTLDSPGPSFWIPGSTSPKSAIVRKNGLQTFAQHAAKKFYPWTDLVGADWCNKFRTEQLGRACDGIFYDEKSYFSKNGFGVWCRDPKENIVGLLKTQRGLSDLKRKGENASELEKALVYIQRNNRVKSAANFAFYPEGRIHVLGEDVLNLHTKKALQPLDAPVAWGPDGEFPFISKFLDTLWLPSEQLPYFLSWLKRFYVGCLRREPRSGHALFIAGGPSVGKTFLSRGIVGGLVAGFAEAHDFLTGAAQFNSELFEKALWTIDDGTISADSKAHTRYSENIKRAVANPSMKCHGKFQIPAVVAWQGRIIITLNTDPESSRMFPNMDISMKGKVLILRTVELPAVQFYAQERMEAILRRELPAFARFLVDYVIPPQCECEDPRFGITPYLETSLISTANQSSFAGAFDEILEEWQRAHFTEREPFADTWSGTALQLHKAILLDPTLTEAMKGFNLQAVGRMLVVLANKTPDQISIEGSERRRVFTIKRDTKLHPKQSTRNTQ